MNSLNEALQRAIQLQQQGDLRSAESLYRIVLNSWPDCAQALHGLGVLASQLDRNDEALRWLGSALQLVPDDACVHHNVGKVLDRVGQTPKAIEHYREALRLNPKLVDAWNDLGNAYRSSREYPQALEAYQEALKIQPDFAIAHYNLAVAYYDLKEFGDAIRAYQNAIQYQPRFAEAYHGLGNIYYELGRLPEALAEFDKAIQFRPDYAEAYNNLGNTLQACHRIEDAIKAYRTSLELSPNNAEVLFNLGNLLDQRRQLEEAHQAYMAAHKLRPDLDVITAAWVLLRQNMGLWEGNDALCQQLHRASDIPDSIHRKGAAAPFQFLCLPQASTAKQQLAATRRWVQEHLQKATSLGQTLRGHRAPKHHSDRIRLGYLSADFHSHATSLLLAEVIEKHNRQRYEVFAYSHGVNDGSPMRQRIENAFEHFRDLYGQDYQAIAHRIKEDQLDILIDLKGYTLQSLPEVIAMRPAPIQVSFLGYPGTMATESIDFILADDFVLPGEQHAYFTERVVWIPGCYQPNDRSPEVAVKLPTRSECGLPEKAIVFCCFNNAYKVTAEMLDAWARILNQVPSSVLWLLAWNPWFEANIRREAVRRGIAVERLIFAPLAPHAVHLARERLADIFLDTFPVTAHTTASDALRVGVPIVTMVGGTFITRVAGSLLRAVGLDELITTHLEEYVATAVALARNPGRLATIRKQLEQIAKEGELYDGERFARKLEAALETILTENRRGSDLLLAASDEAQQWMLRGLQEAGRQQWEQAIAAYQQAIRYFPHYADAYNNLGNAYRAVARMDEAEQAYRQAVAIQPAAAEALCNLALLLQSRGELTQAIECMQQAVSANASIPELHFNLGQAYAEVGEAKMAEQAYRQALQLRSNFPQALNNLGNALQAQHRISEAREAYQMAIHGDPLFTHALLNLARMELHEGQTDVAQELLERVLAIEPKNVDAGASLLLIRQSNCRWDGLDVLAQRVVDAIESDPLPDRTYPHLSPLCFMAASQGYSSAQLKQIARRCLQRVDPVQPPLHRERRLRSGAKPITIGYLSADFRDHPVGYLLSEMIESHDRHRFQVYAYASSLSTTDATRVRLEKAFDRFRNIHGLSHSAAAQRIADDEVDILVDLGGHTVGSQLELLSWRPAPIQASYLGFAGTSGAEYIDYVFVDEYVVPSDRQPDYTEKLVHLPGCFMVQDRQRTVAVKAMDRRQAGLPDEGIVFCGFSQPFKITQIVFDIWLRLLKKVPKSVLWLRAESREVHQRWLDAAVSQGIAADRLIFAPHVSMTEHLARQACADLFLDTFPYNQHSTAADALHVGLPVVTVAGNTFASRVAGSLLHELGMDDLIAADLDHYEKLAEQIAVNTGRRQALRQRLVREVATSSLFDGRSFAAKIEQAYQILWERHQRGEIPSMLTLRESPEILYNRGNAFARNGNYGAAIDRYQKALETRPDMGPARRNLAKVYWLAGHELFVNRQSQPAITYLEAAIKIQPDLAGAHHELGCVWQQLGQCDRAIEAYQRSLELGYTQGALAYVNQLQHVCDWSRIGDWPELIHQRAEAMSAANEPMPPFPFLALIKPTSPHQQLQCARRWAQEILAKSQSVSNKTGPHDRQSWTKSGKIRVGFVSADFRDHATAWLIAEMLETRDRSQFEYIGYATSPPSDTSRIGIRFQKAFDRFQEIWDLADDAAASRIFADEIDILVDLKGYTIDSRAGVLAHRPAPIQVSFLGFPATMGAPFVDYLIADKFVIPPEYAANYSEKIAYLPGCYQPNDSRVEISPLVPKRQDVGLPEVGLIMGCMNLSYKITPDIFQIWMRLLQHIPSSVLWLLASNTWAPKNLQREATRWGVDPSRIIFASRCDHPEHLARQKLIELALDTYPVSAHTVAGELLRAGIPLVTLIGDTFASRVAGSLLHTLGMEQLIAKNLAEYEAIAMRLATDKAALATCRHELEQSLKSSNLFSGQAFAKKIEAAFQRMWEIHRLGRPPETFEVGDAAFP